MFETDGKATETKFKKMLANLYHGNMDLQKNHQHLVPAKNYKELNEKSMRTSSLPSHIMFFLPTQ